MMDFAGQSFASHAEFYNEIYPGAVTDLHPAGRTGAVLMRTVQDSGDWSDAATPDLVITRPTTYRVSGTLNLGAGEFKVVTKLNCFTVFPPLTATTVLAEAPYSTDVLAIPYANLIILCGEDAHLPADGDFGSLHSRLGIDLEIAVLFDRLFGEMASGSRRGALYVDSILLHLTARLLEIRDSPTPQRTDLVHGGLAPWQVKRVCEAMIAAMDAGEEEASLAELALTVGLSANHFCRGFAQSTGLPPHRWMTERRIERAGLLLLDPRLSLTEIALILGYTSQSAFGRAFARVTGVAPSVRRRELLS